MLRHVVSAALLLHAVCAVTHTDAFSETPSTDPYFVKDGEDGPLLQCTVKPEYRDRKQFDISWIRWHKKNIWHLTRNERLYEKEHYDLVQDPVTGTYNIRLKKIEREKSEGMYQCTVLNTDTGTQYHTDSANVVVLVPPADPVIDSYPDYVVAEYEQVSVKCSVAGGSPQPTISWVFDNKTRAPADMYTQVVKDELVESTIHWSARPEDNGAFVTCQATNKAMETDPPKEVQSPRFNIVYKPVVHAGPTQDYTVEAGQMIELACTADANPAPPSYEWKHISSGERYVSASWPLVAEKRLAGEYECRARNNVGEGSDRLTLNVQYTPIVTTKERVNPAEGETVIVECSVEANPRAESIEWTGPNGFKQTGAKLVLTNVQGSQSGNYSCSATNYLTLYGQTGSAQRTGSATTLVDVKRRPGAASIEAKSTNILVGGTIELRCWAEDEGSPLAAYKWASPTSGGQFGTKEHDRPTLTISNAQLADNGVYRCRAHNAIGEGEEASVKVTVIEPAAISRPLATERIYNEGEQAGGVECEARGYPAPTIRWEKDGVPVSSRYMIHSSRAASNCAADEPCSQSVISQLDNKHTAEWIDKGNFSCIAENGAGAATTWTLVRVVHGPVILNDRFGKADGGLAAVEPGYMAQVVCRVSARPEPSFVWLHDASEIEETGRYSIRLNRLVDRPDEYESVLQIADATEADFGQYMCRATNGKSDKAEIVITLKQKSLPQTPDLLQKLSSTATSLQIGWKGGFDGGFAQSFIVEYRTLNPFTESVDSENVATTEVRRPERVYIETQASRGRRSVSSQSLLAFNLTGLMPLSTYYFRVRASNEKGISDFTPIVIANTQDVAIDQSITAPAALRLDARIKGIDVEPPVPVDRCMLLYVATSSGTWRSAGCYSAEEKIQKLIGGEKFKARVCRREEEQLVCGGESKILAAGALMSSQWRLALVVPIAVLVFICLLVLALVVICCRVRPGGSDKKRKISEVKRPEVSSPMPQPSTKTSAIHGSATDSGVFTLDSAQPKQTPFQGDQPYSSPSSNETGVDMWQSSQDYDYNTDGYLGPEYNQHTQQQQQSDSQAEAEFYRGYPDGSGSSNADEEEEEEAEESEEAYGSRRVMREIIV